MRKLIIAGVITFIIFALTSVISIGFHFFVGSMISSMGHTEAAETAKEFLRQNRKLKDFTGELRESPSFVGGKINANDAGGEAYLSFEVEGERKEVTANVSLRSQNKGNWQIADADYIDDAGETVDLLNK